MVDSVDFRRLEQWQALESVDFVHFVDSKCLGILGPNHFACFLDWFDLVSHHLVAYCSNLEEKVVVELQIVLRLSTLKSNFVQNGFIVRKFWAETFFL